MPYYIYMWILQNFRYGEEDILIATVISQSPGIIVKKWRWITSLFISFIMM